MKNAVWGLILLAMLAAALGLTLAPNNGNLNYVLPDAVRKWVNNDHDEEANLIAFTVLGTVALSFARRPPSRETWRRNPMVFLLSSRTFRVMVLLTLICLIELVQNFIPGRVSDLGDMCTGWSGIFTGWLCSVLLDEREKGCDSEGRFRQPHVQRESIIGTGTAIR